MDVEGNAGKMMDIKSDTGTKKSDKTGYLTPIRSTNFEGRERRVGVELEFIGLETEEAAQIVAQSTGGRLVARSPHHYEVTGSNIGKITVLLDTQYVQGSSDSEPTLVEKARNTLGEIVKPIVPQELVTDPIPVKYFPFLDSIISDLRNAGAVGTDDNLLYAFGLHLNPDTPALDSTHLLSIVRSMILMDDPLRGKTEMDPTRELLGWARSYTNEFAFRVMQPDYQPTLEGLAEDYVLLNPGRNYHLDLLPLFRFVAPELMQQLLGDKHPASRPAFHFRLPNSLVHHTNWGIREDWNHWVAIENQAENLHTEQLEKWLGKAGIW